MIITRLRGRLGNHLFQVFTVISAAIATGQSFAFYQQNVNPSEGTWWDSVFNQLTRHHVFFNELVHKYTYTQKSSCHYDSKLSNHVKKWYKKVGYLDGHFIHFKYFEEHFHTIVGILGLELLQKQVFFNFAPLCKSIDNWNNTVSLHFRIGDYPNHGYHVLSSQYYFEALNSLVKKLQKFDVIYFCEISDITKVIPIIQTFEPQFPGVTFQKAPEGLKDWEEMLFMSCCQHHIIANSTFSLWGALLGLTHNTHSKWIVYPEDWCKVVMGDSIPSHWIPINVL